MLSPSKVWWLSGQIQNSFMRPTKPCEPSRTHFSILLLLPQDLCTRSILWVPFSSSCRSYLQHHYLRSFPDHNTSSPSPHITSPSSTRRICNFIFLLSPCCPLCSMRGRTVSGSLTILFPGPDKVGTKCLWDE